MIFPTVTTSAGTSYDEGECGSDASDREPQTRKGGRERREASRRQRESDSASAGAAGDQAASMDFSNDDTNVPQAQSILLASTPEARMQMALGGELPWGEHDIAGLAAAAVTSPAAVLSLAASTSFSNGSTATMVPDDGPDREGLASGQWKEWAAPDSPTIGALHHETLVNAAPVRRDGGDLDMDTINQIIACAAAGAPESVAAPGVQDNHPSCLESINNDDPLGGGGSQVLYEMFKAAADGALSPNPTPVDGMENSRVTLGVVDTGSAGLNVEPASPQNDEDAWSAGIGRWTGAPP